jgi:hypothetical protein
MEREKLQEEEGVGIVLLTVDKNKKRMNLMCWWEKVCDRMDVLVLLICWAFA